MGALIDLAMRLAEISDRDLQTLRTTIDAVPNTAPGLMVWLEHAVNCESDQRAGRVYPLLGPMSAIPDEELAQSIAAAEVLAAQFRGDGSEIAVLFDLVGVILQAKAERPDKRQ